MGDEPRNAHPCYLSHTRAETLFLAVVLVLVAVILWMGPTPAPPSRVAEGPDWESPKCMRDTEEMRPFAFAVCYERP